MILFMDCLVNIQTAIDHFDFERLSLIHLEMGSTELSISSSLSGLPILYWSLNVGVATLKVETTDSEAFRPG